MKTDIKLLKKEFALAKHPTMFFFPLFALMLLIPSYPYLIAFMYTCLEVFFIFITGRETNDVFYTVSLPVRKRDVVKARCGMIAMIQLFQIVISIPVALLRARLTQNVGPNGAGLEANVALFGFALMMYALFNALLLPVFYKDAHSAGKGLLFGGSAVLLFIAAVEVLAHAFPALDSIARADQMRQLPILAAGIVIYALGLWQTCRVAAARFEKVDL